MFIDHAIETADGMRGWATGTGRRGWVRVRFLGEPTSAVCLRVDDLRIIYADYVPLSERWA